MTMLRKCNARNRPANNSVDKRDSSKPMPQTRTANSPKIKPDRSCARRRSFIEDFTMEHSLPGPHIISLGISGCF